MPLPFSFSAQRQGYDSDPAVGAASGGVGYGSAAQAPTGPVTAELLASYGFQPSGFVDSLAATASRMQSSSDMLAPIHQPLAQAPQPQAAAPAFLTDTLPLPVPSLAFSPPAVAPSTQLHRAQPPDWAAQMEQLRHDIFSIATNVSAMSDRIDRLDQNAPQAAMAGVAALRTEIQTWLENYLSVAVEHCMHRIMTRVPSQPAPN